MSSIRGGASSHGASKSHSASALASAATAAAIPETPAEMAERLKAERSETLIRQQEDADARITAEMIGFALATEIGERACDLYINTMYDKLASEYTALAVWDEMMDNIKSFAAARPAELPSFASLEFEKPVPLPAEPGLAAPEPAVPPPLPPSALKPVSSLSGVSGAAAGGASGAAAAAAPAAAARPRRARFNVSESPAETAHESPQPAAAAEGGGGGGDCDGEHATSLLLEKARTDLAAAVEAKLKSEASVTASSSDVLKECASRKTFVDPLNYVPDFKLDFSPPPLSDATWAPDTIPPPMICDLTARHAAGIRLKLVERPPTAPNSDLADTVMNRTRGTMVGSRRTGTGTMIGGSMTTSASNPAASGRPTSGTMVRPLSGTMIGAASTMRGIGATHQSPSAAALHDISKDVVPIHILTHHMSMMASASPHLANRKKKSDNNNNNTTTSSAKDDDDNNNNSEQAHGDPLSVRTRSPADAGGAEKEAAPFSDWGGGNGKVPAHVPLPDADDHVSAGDYSSVADDESVQSPSEAEVAQKQQQRHAQRTRNATAFTTITNQLAEQTGGGKQPQQLGGGGVSSSLISASSTSGGAGDGSVKNGGAAEKAFVVDSRLGRVIAVTSVEAGTKGKAKANPITEAPRFAIIAPPPPPDPAELQNGGASGGAKGYFRRNIPSSSANNSNNKDNNNAVPPTATVSVTTADPATTTAPVGGVGLPTATQRRASPSMIGGKKSRNRANDPSNFFQPETRVVPMIPVVNPTGGVIIKDDNGSRRNERPPQANRMTRSDYSKLLRVAPSVAAANASDFGEFDLSQQLQQQQSQQQRNRNGPQTARAGAAAAAGGNNQQSAAGSPAKTARR